MVALTYGSVCSGIEAASIAWESLGLTPQWFAEIEKFPSAVLAHHWPEVTNLGDMTKIAAAILAGEVDAPDVLVGGTPCQAFSLAGLRQGLDDARGQLTLAFVELANAIDRKRAEEGKEPCIIVWENVPGVLSMPDNAFGNFIAGLAGENEAIEPGSRPNTGKNSKFWRWKKSTGYHVAKWPHCGGAYGQQRAVAWRLLNAQHFGVAQRRRRVFVIASARKGFDPVQILAEFNGLRRDSAPSRKPGQIASALTTNGVGVRGADDNQAQAGHLIPTVCMAHGQSGAEIKTDNSAPTLTCNHEAPIIVEGESFTGFNNTGHGFWVDGEFASTIRAGDSNGGGGARESTLITFPAQMSGTQFHAAEGEVCQTLQALNPTAVAVALRGRDGGTTAELGDEVSGALRSAEGGACKSYVLESAQRTLVRRLMPHECERLQGFPDGHTLVPFKGKNALDGPRYKAIGNSMAVPVMNWIMRRILAAIAQPTCNGNLHVEAGTLTDEGTKTSQHVSLMSEGDNLPEIPESSISDIPTWKIGDPLTPTHIEDEPEAEVVAIEAVRTKSFLKWVGGKFDQLDSILEVMPRGRRLFEPFVGGGSVFMNADYQSYVLADDNPDLINLYTQLKRSPDNILEFARRLFADFNTADRYLEVRQDFNERNYSPESRAGAFLFLNRHSFNGLVRYNKRGGFNVGWGKYKKTYYPEKEVNTFLERAKQCTFLNIDYRETIELAGADDVIFCDPPYEPMPGKNGFTSYTGDTFGFDKQIALVDSLLAARERGARVVITNSSAPKILDLYIKSGFTLYEMDAKRSISCDGKTREIATDILGVLL